MTRPAWTMYHPNGKGTGSALRLELHPAHGQTNGSIFATLVPQKAFIGDGTTYAEFDTDTNAVTYRLHTYQRGVGATERTFGTYANAVRAFDDFSKML